MQNTEANPQDSSVTCQCGNCAIPMYMSFVSDVMVGMGFTREEVRESLINQKYNEVTATYLLLGRKNEVRVSVALFDEHRLLIQLSLMFSSFFSYC